MTKPDYNQPKVFDIMPIIDAQDRTSDCTRKLKCVAALLAVADLECLGNSAPDGEALRDGLGCILYEIADEYERNIAQLREEYDRCQGVG